MIDYIKRCMIHKQELNIVNHERIELKLPKEAEILKIAIQNGVPVIWYKFETSNLENLETRVLFMGFTGVKFEYTTEIKMVYIDTLMTNELVYSIFEVVHNR